MLTNANHAPNPFINARTPNISKMTNVIMVVPCVKWMKIDKSGRGFVPIKHPQNLL